MKNIHAVRDFNKVTAAQADVMTRLYRLSLLFCHTLWTTVKYVWIYFKSKCLVTPVEKHCCI